MDKTFKELLEPMNCGSFVVGHVAEVNGGTSLEIPGVTVTLHELLVIARHWMQEIYEIAVLWLECGQTGSDEIRMEPYAYARLADLLPIIVAETERLCSKAPMDRKTLRDLRDIREELLIRSGNDYIGTLDHDLLSRVDAVLTKHGLKPEPVPSPAPETSTDQQNLNNMT